jgi:hypothetical protein
MRRNITMTLDDDLIQKARVLAARRNRSVSAGRSWRTPATCSSSGSPLGLIMQDHELALAKGKLRVGVPLVIGELDLKDARREGFDDSADLAAKQASLGQIGGKGHDIE